MSTRSGTSITVPNVYAAIVTNGYTEDRASVSALPDDWTPVHSTSDTIGKYLSERAANHDRALVQLVEEAAAVNRDVEEQIRLEASIMLNYIEDYDRKAAEILNRDLLHEADKVPMQTKLEELWSQKVKDIYSFKDATDLLETRRVDSLKKLLGVHFQKIVQVGHKAPSLLLEDFQEKIYRANQQVLCNARTHSELRAMLLAQADTTRTRAMAKLEELAIRHLYRLVRSSSSDFLHEQSKKESALAFPDTSIRRSKSSMLSSSLSCSDSASELHVLKQEVKELFLEYYVKLEVLHKDLLDQSVDQKNLDSKDALLSVSLIKRSQPVNSPASGSFDGNPLNLSMSTHDVWRDGVDTLSAVLGNEYARLRDSVQICNEQARRLAQLRRLTCALLEENAAAHRDIEAELEGSLDTAVTELRQAAELDKLDKLYEAVQTMLQNIAQVYNKHHKFEMDALTRFTATLNESTEELIERITISFEEDTRTSSGSEETEYESEEPVMAPAMLQNNALVIGVKICTNELAESLRRKLLVRPERLRARVAEWIQDRTIQLKIKLKAKMSRHAARTDVVKDNAMERRRDELKFHEIRLASHIQATNELLAELTMDVTSLANLDSTQIFPLRLWLEDIQKRMEEGAAVELKLLSYRQRLSRMRSQMETSLREAIERYREEVDRRLEEACAATEQFLARVLLFPEGGEYSTSEAARTVAALNRSAGALKDAHPKLTAAIDKRHAEILQEANADIQIVENSVNEAMLQFRPAAQPQRVTAKKIGKK